MNKDRPQFNRGDIFPGLIVGYGFKVLRSRHAQAPVPVTEAPVTVPAQSAPVIDETVTIARWREQKARELRKIKADVVEIDPRAAQMAAACKEKGSGYFEAHFPPELPKAGQKRQDSHGYDIRSFGSNLKDLDKQAFKVNHQRFEEHQYSPHARELIAAKPQDLDTIIHELFKSGDIKTADIKWAFQKDSMAGYTIVGLRMMAVPVDMLGWGSDYRPSIVGLDMRIPDDLARQLRAAPLKNGQFARSFVQQMFPDDIAQRGVDAIVTDPQTQKGKIYLAPLSKTPVVTIKDQR